MNLKNILYAGIAAGVLASGCSQRTIQDEMIYKAATVEEGNIYLTFSRDKRPGLNFNDDTKMVGVGDTTGLIIGNTYTIALYDNTFSPDRIKVQRKK